MITLRGQDFGSFVPGLSKVVFETPDQSIRIEAGRPYVWRDDFIQVRVPAGGGGHKTPKSELRVSVEAVGGASASLPFQLLVRVNKDDLSFVERTHIVNHADVSGFLGDVDSNKARTKNGVGQTMKDLTEHPWAGVDVVLTLVARDEGNNEGRSAPHELRLPERPLNEL
jgi:hypothetical protein